MAWDDGSGRGERRTTQVLPLLRRVKREMGRDHVDILAAAIAFWGMLSIFPAMIALVTLYGLVSDPAEVARQMNELAAWLPGEARTLIGEQLERVASAESGSLGVGLALSVGGAIWTASAGMNSLVQGINMAYGTEDRRSTIRRRGLGLALTLMAVLVAVVMLLAIAAVPALINAGVLPRFTEKWLSWGRWPALVLILVVALAAIDYLAPCRPKPHWRWITPGAVVATVLWMAMSVLFSIYVQNFGKYNETYGALGAVVVLMMWVYLSSYAILLGAEINAEIEAARQPEHVPG